MMYIVLFVACLFALWRLVSWSVDRPWKGHNLTPTSTQSTLRLFGKKHILVAGRWMPVGYLWRNA
jgi:hypothetical protein